MLTFVVNQTISEVLNSCAVHASFSAASGDRLQNCRQLLSTATKLGIHVDAIDERGHKLHESIVTRARSMQVRGDGVNVPAATADPDAKRLHIKVANKKRIVTCMLLDACSKRCDVIYSMPWRSHERC